jgi:stress-induced morphogen
MLSRLARPARTAFTRFLATLSDAEKKVEEKIRSGLSVKDIKVQDTSGGCGAMYSIEVVADDFKGQSIVKQHQMASALLPGASSSHRMRTLPASAHLPGHTCDPGNLEAGDRPRRR